MDTELRPLSLSEILDRIAQLYRTHFLLFAGIAAVYAGSLLLVGLVQIGLQELLNAAHHANWTILLNLGFAAIQWLIMFLLGGLAVAANNRAVSWVHLGEPATIRGAYSGVWPRFGTYLWLMFLIAVVLWTPLALCYGGFAAVAFVRFRPFLEAATQTATQKPPSPQDALIFGLLALAFFALAFAAIVYAVLMGLRYSLAVPACVVEKLKAREALKRSIDLGKGSRARIFMLGLLCLAIQFGLAGISQSFFVIMAVKDHGVLPAWARVLQLIVAFFTNSFTAPIYATGLTLFYYDQRVRKEGYDIVRMMEAAGMTPPAALPADRPEEIAPPPPATEHPTE